MKLRIQGDSIRLRLASADVEQFRNTGFVKETAHFPDGRRLVYGIQSSSTGEGMSASFDGEVLTVSVLNRLARSWTETDQVGLRSVSSIDERNLDILAEKDLTCGHDRLEEVDDHPNVLDVPRAS